MANNNIRISRCIDFIGVCMTSLEIIPATLRYSSLIVDLLSPYSCNEHNATRVVTADVHVWLITHIVVNAAHEYFNSDIMCRLLKGVGEVNLCPRRRRLR